MWRLKTSYILFALVCFSLFALAPLPGDAYLITGSEITQILDECEVLKIELSILKSNSLADKESLKRLGENLTALESKLQKAESSLTNTQSDLRSALEQFAEVQTQLKELEASLKQSKRAALWQSNKVGGICLGVGVVGGFVVGLIYNR
jgi:chromosome segregation ATPase